MRKLTKKQSKNSSYRPKANLEDWLDREEEKRELGERTLPINEMDDILPIYDTDGLPFEEDLVFNDVEGMTASPSEATIEKALGIKPSRYAGMPLLTVSEGTLRMSLLTEDGGVHNYEDVLIKNIAGGYHEEFDEDENDEEPCEHEKYDSRTVQTHQESPPKAILQKGNNNIPLHKTVINEKQKEPFSNEEPNWTFRNRPVSKHNFDIYAFNLVNLIRQFYRVDKTNPINRGYLAEKIRNTQDCIPFNLASYILALETVGKQQWIRSEKDKRKQLLPFQTYKTVIGYCRKYYDKSFESSIEEYRKDHEGKSPGITKEKYLQMVYTDLRERKIKLPERLHS